MKTIENLFDHVAKAITSLAAVIFILLAIITGMVLFSHTLFMDVFPDTMAPWEKIAATWSMAIGWEATVLLTTVNTRHINKNIPGLMAICSGIIVLFFIQAFDSSQSWLIISQRWFVGLLAATINYIYSDLFFAKWKERNDTLRMPALLNELQHTVKELRMSIDEKTKDLTHRERELKETTSLLVELKAYKAKIQSELKCPHCKVVQDNFGTLHAHKGHCSENPKNKSVRKELNSHVK